MMEIMQQLVPGKRKVIVYDIDDTIINSQTNLVIYPIYKTIILANLKGFSVILITARRGFLESIETTRMQLKMLGIKYDKIYFLPKEFKQTEKNIEKFKKTVRRHIHENGQEVVISVGDRHWDIGEFGGVGFHIQQ